MKENAVLKRLGSGEALPHVFQSPVSSLRSGGLLPDM
ncbi:hypothetical protein BBR47_56810 [Brevibacillus brevis NBRC 100599]|uniref:Uncharacterized protein n=1 Tax=Brevibacillus brevis (strain 47 / JCM 6285 / NBRC 100599) TaxID=358681 RepID=C0Z8N1_BREBN|nr:hypothetical protein BBR47_56810 [Brevibacillus brevis NBRC 100599]